MVVPAVLCSPAPIASPSPLAHRRSPLDCPLGSVCCSHSSPTLSQPPSAHLRHLPCRSAPAMADDSPFGDFTNEQQQSSPYVEDGDEPVIALPPPSVPTTASQPIQIALMCTGVCSAVTACNAHANDGCLPGAGAVLRNRSRPHLCSRWLADCRRVVWSLSVSDRCWRLCVAVAVAMTTPSRAAMHRCTMVRLRTHSV